MLNYDVLNKEIINNNFTKKYFTPYFVENINDFYKKIPKIVFNKKDFLINCVNSFCYEKLSEKHIVNYFNTILEVIAMVENHINDIKEHLVITDGDLCIEAIAYAYNEKKAIITFSTGDNIVFRYSCCDEQIILNSIMQVFNEKINKKYKLYIMPVVNCEKCSFTKFFNSPGYLINNKPSNYYFKFGELLALTYMLNLSNIRNSNLVYIGEDPVLQDLSGIFNSSENLEPLLSAKDISTYIFRHSVYNIEFLSREKNSLKKSNIESIKSGFQYIYDIITNNKNELIKVMNILFNNNTLYLSRIITKIYSFNKNDLLRQLYFIDIKLSNIKDEKTSIHFSEDDTPCNLEKGNLIEIACNLGDYIIQNGIIGYKNSIISRTWITTVSDANFGNGITVSPTSYNLHDGNSGIALFFLYLGVISKKNYFITSALEAMEDCINHIKSLNNEPNASLDAFKAITGEIYTLSKIYAVTKDHHIKCIIKDSLFYIKRSIKDNISINTSKVIGVLLSMYTNIAFIDIKDELLDLANLCYNNIVSNMPLENTLLSLDYPLNEFIIFSAKLMSITSNKSIECSINTMLNFQRSREYLVNIQNKASFNKEYADILLSRIILRKYGYTDKLLNEEIAKTLEFTIKNGFGNSAFYSNGDIKSFEILEYAAEVLKDTNLKNRCHNTFDNLVLYVIRPKINRTIKYGNMPISLFSGVSGLGYNFIRYYNKDLVPMVLLLE